MNRLGVILLGALGGFIVLGFVVPIVSIEVNLHLNRQDRQALLEEFRTRHPEIRFTGSESYERRQVYIRAYGVTDQAKQSQIREELMAFKTERKVGAAIRLTFWGNDLPDELAAFEF